MGLSDSNQCATCNATDSYIHAFWLCTHTLSFWLAIAKRLSLILDLSIPMKLSFCLLGDLSDITVKPSQKKFILISLMIAKKAILLHWKNCTKVSITQWIYMLPNHSNMEQLTSTIKDKTEQYNQIWLPFINFLKES